MSLMTEKDFRADQEFALVKYRELTSGSDALSPETAHTVAQSMAEPFGLHYVFPEHCFLCHEKITLPFILWASEHDIGLHIACAERFIKALERDIIEYRYGREFAQSWYAIQPRERRGP